MVESMARGSNSNRLEIGLTYLVSLHNTYYRKLWGCVGFTLVELGGSGGLLNRGRVLSCVIAIENHYQ